MIFNENEAWIPDEGNDVILTSPPVLKIVKAKTEDLDEDEGIDGEMIEEFEDAVEAWKWHGTIIDWTNKVPDSWFMNHRTLLLIGYKL